MSQALGGPESGTSARVVGVRTRESDRVQWAVVADGQMVRPGDWVRLSATGQVGRVIAGPGMVVGVLPEALSTVAPVTVHDQRHHAEPPQHDHGPWGRIGHRDRTTATDLSSETESKESERYRQLKDGMPPLGSRYTTEPGAGIVVSSDAFEGTLLVLLDESSDVIEVRHRPSRS